MRKKEDFIFNQYLIDYPLFTISLLILPLGILWFVIFTIASDLYFLIGVLFCLLIFVLLILNLVRLKKILKSKETTIINLSNCNAFIKIKPENKNMGEIIVKIFIKVNNKRYDLYYLNGSKTKFLAYKDLINNSDNIMIKVYKNTSIVESIYVDNEEYDDLYKEVIFSEKLENPITYTHLFKEKKINGIYKYVLYKFEDVYRILNNSKISDELYIIDDKYHYLKIINNPDEHAVYLEDKKSSKEELFNWLDNNGFIIDECLKVIYTFDQNDPMIFQLFINGE